MRRMNRTPKFRIGDKVVFLKGLKNSRAAVVQSIDGGMFISENHEPVYVISFLPSVNATVYEKDLLPHPESETTSC